MMEIEFRGKQKDTGGWVYGGYTKPEFPVRDYAVIWESWEGGAGFGSHVVPETVGQFAGLKDKNGVKIFDGDIIKRSYNESNGNKVCKKYLVLFERGAFWLFEIDDFYSLYKKRPYLSPNGFLLHDDYLMGEQFNKERPSCERQYEVIGNIHDNPKFWEEAK